MQSMGVQHTALGQGKLSVKNKKAVIQASVLEFSYKLQIIVFPSVTVDKFFSMNVWCAGHVLQSQNFSHKEQ